MASAARRFVGLDVHRETTSICVRDRAGKVVEQTVIATTAAAIRRFFRPRLGTVVTAEEGPLAAWLYRLLHGRVDDVFICNPRYNRLLRAGVKNDRIDAAKLAELLRLGALHRVHHELTPIALRELVAHYSIVISDRTRTMQRIKAVFRGNGISTAGVTVYANSHRRKWIQRLKCAGARSRVSALYQQLDVLTALREDARTAMLDEASLFEEFDVISTVPFIGAIRAAQLLAYVGGTRRFYRRSHLWSYAGLAVTARSSSDHRIEDGRVVARPRFSRGLTRNFNPQLKRVLKDTALAASFGRGPLRSFFDAHVQRGLTPSVARVVLARRIASTLRAMLRDLVPFDASLFVSGLPGAGGKHQKVPLPVRRGTCPTVCASGTGTASLHDDCGTPPNAAERQRSSPARRDARSPFERRASTRSTTR